MAYVSAYGTHEDWFDERKQHVDSLFIGDATVSRNKDYGRQHHHGFRPEQPQNSEKLLNFSKDFREFRQGAIHACGRGPLVQSLRTALIWHQQISGVSGTDNDKIGRSPLRLHFCMWTRSQPCSQLSGWRRSGLECSRWLSATSDLSNSTALDLLRRHLRHPFSCLLRAGPCQFLVTLSRFPYWNNMAKCLAGCLLQIIAKETLEVLDYPKFFPIK